MHTSHGTLIFYIPDQYGTSILFRICTGPPCLINIAPSLIGLGPFLFNVVIIKSPKQSFVDLLHLLCVILILLLLHNI